MAAVETIDGFAFPEEEQDAAARTCPVHDLEARGLALSVLGTALAATLAWPMGRLAAVAIGSWAGAPVPAALAPHLATALFLGLILSDPLAALAEGRRAAWIGLRFLLGTCIGLLLHGLVLGPLMGGVALAPLWYVPAVIGVALFLCLALDRLLVCPGRTMAGLVEEFLLRAGPLMIITGYAVAVGGCGGSGPRLQRCSRWWCCCRRRWRCGPSGRPRAG